MAGVAPARETAAAHPLRDRFLRWQCRTRQIAMREAGGRPDDAATPALTPRGAAAPIGRIVTVLSRLWAHSLTPEMRHICRRTHDPAERREKALALFAAGYFQEPGRFSDRLTATFPPGSPGAARIAAAGGCRLDFAAYSQSFALECAVERLHPSHPLWQATWWHNHLFNPELPPDTVVLAFTPDWEQSAAEP